MTVLVFGMSCSGSLGELIEYRADRESFSESPSASNHPLQHVSPPPEVVIRVIGLASQFVWPALTVFQSCCKRAVTSALWKTGAARTWLLVAIWSG